VFAGNCGGGSPFEENKKKKGVSRSVRERKEMEGGKRDGGMEREAGGKEGNKRGRGRKGSRKGRSVGGGLYGRREGGGGRRGGESER